MTMTTHPRPGDLPAWHSTFAASAEAATSTVHARGTLDIFTVDLLQGAIDVLAATGCVDITLDLGKVSSLDRAAAWCIAETNADLASRHGRLTIVNARTSVQTSLGNLGRPSSPTGTSTDAVIHPNTRIPHSPTTNPSTTNFGELP